MNRGDIHGRQIDGLEHMIGIGGGDQSHRRATTRASAIVKNSQGWLSGTGRQSTQPFAGYK